MERSWQWEFRDAYGLESGSSTASAATDVIGGGLAGCGGDSDSGASMAEESYVAPSVKSCTYLLTSFASGEIAAAQTYWALKNSV